MSARPSLTTVALFSMRHFSKADAEELPVSKHTTLPNQEVSCVPQFFFSHAHKYLLVCVYVQLVLILGCMFRLCYAAKEVPLVLLTYYIDLFDSETGTN